jgi:TrmH family RNA methyltransferase
MSPSSIRVVLIRPTHAGNIGACARAMKTMGLESLWLVAPEAGIDAEARAMAAHATDLLERAAVARDLEAALADCRWVIGTSARTRRLGCPVISPRDAAGQLVAEGRHGPVALLFGQERTGLTNEELDRCRAVVSIPANPDYPSLNLAAAVQILAYEVRLALLAAEAEAGEGEIPARPRQEDLERFHEHLERVLIQTQFLDPEKPRFLMRRLRRFFNRADPDENELNILRGILTSVERLRRP